MPSTWGSFYPKTKLVGAKEKELRFLLGDQKERASVASTVLPIWVNDSFKPSRIRLITGKTELLPGLGIVKKLDIGVCFGRDRAQVGQGEWGMMTFNEKHYWVFPLVPSACDYPKLDGYFGKFLNAEISALQAQGNSGGHLAARRVIETKNQRLEIKMGKSKAIVSDVKYAIRNTFAKMANALSGFEGQQ